MVSCGCSGVWVWGLGCGAEGIGVDESNGLFRRPWIQLPAVGELSGELVTLPKLSGASGTWGRWCPSPGGGVEPRRLGLGGEGALWSVISPRIEEQLASKPLGRGRDARGGTMVQRGARRRAALKLHLNSNSAAVLSLAFLTHIYTQMPPAVMLPWPLPPLHCALPEAPLLHGCCSACPVLCR